MPIDVSALKALAAAGATVDMIIAAVEAQQAAERKCAIEEAELQRDALKQKRSDARERKRLQRQRDNPSFCVSSLRHPQPVTRDTSPNVPIVTRDNAPPPFPLPSPPTPPLTNPLTPFDDVDARERGGSDLAAKLADQVMTILSVDRAEPPRLWRGLADYLQRGIVDRAWRSDLVLAAARRVAAAFEKRTGEKHPESCGYLTRPIEQEHERHERGLALMTKVIDVDPAAVDRARAATVWVGAGDERFKAWDAYHRATRGAGLPTDAKGGWHVPTDWPPDHPKASEAA
jgi:hypothetical protein